MNLFNFQSRISRLPAYLTVQFVRFYYKEKEAVNAKILKEVKYPFEFDAFELCTPELQERLKPMRERFKVCYYITTCAYKLLLKHQWRIVQLI